MGAAARLTDSQIAERLLAALAVGPLTRSEALQLLHREHISDHPTLRVLRALLASGRITAATETHRFVHRVNRTVQTTRPTTYRLIPGGNHDD